MKRKLLFAAIMIASALGGNLYAQFDADKTYVISNNNDANMYMQDNGTGVVAMGSKNDNSFWKFVATANDDCYYIQNAATGKYLQGYDASEQEVATGDTGVEYYVKADAEGSLSGKFRFAVTSLEKHDFSNGTLGLNWKNNNTVQSFASAIGNNPRSAWNVVEEAMPQPQPVVTPLFESNKTYIIECNNQSGKYIQDNGDGYLVPASKNNNSYWMFEATANDGCYYVKNAKTGKYMQKTSEYEVSVKTGDDPVEIYIKNDPAKGTNVYGLASTDRTPHDFSSDETWGANYTANYVQGFSAVLGGRPNSFWKIVEEAMPQPITGLSSPYAGVAPAVGNEYYLYNVKTGKWMGDNHLNTDGSWTSHGELGPRGRDIELKAGNGDGRFILNPKLSHNYSINGSNLYMDTGDGVTNWIFTPVDVEGVTNCYSLTTPGGRAMGAKADGWATSEPGDIAENGNIWQLVSREQRLAAMQVGDDCSWLVLGGTFPVDDSHKNEDAYRVWQGDFGSNALGGDGLYHCNRVWELWGISDRDVYQDITVPNGKFKFKAQAIYASTGGGDMNEDRYNEYLADPTGNTKGVVYANNATTPMINVYSLVTKEKVNDKNTKEITSGVWAYNGTNEFSTNIFEGKGWTDEVEVEVTDGKLRVGAKVEGATSAWMLLDNFTLTYSGEIVIQNLTPYIEALDQAIAAAESFDSSTTTDALAAALATALANAQSVSQTDANAMTNVTNALEEALQLAQTVDVTVLRAAIQLAQTEGISVPTSVTDFLVKGTVNEVETHLRLVRNLRKLNAIEKIDISMIECSEPADVVADYNLDNKADYYLYNVGAQIFFSTTSDWGTHIAIDNPGMLIHFRPDGEWSGAAGRPVFHLSGNGWDGMNWQEEYWDKNGENKLAFVPVEGKDKVYNMCEWDNYEWHFVYDPAEDVCDGNTHYWNAVQKRKWNRNDYKDNPYAQWMLVSPEAYKAAMAKASETEPLDVTFLMENPNFTKAKVNGSDNWDRGWTGVGTMTGRGRDPWCAIEWFQADADMKQTITGLTPGKYQVSCYGFYRDGSCANEATKMSNGEALIQNAFLYANDKEVALPNVSSETGNMPGIGEKDGVKYEFACWPWEANEYFQTGLYKATTPVVEVGEDGELTIGVKSTYNGVGESWVVVGNFRLTSLGTKETIDVTITDAGYATLVAPFDATMPAGVTASTAEVNGQSIELTVISGAVPAHTPVILSADAATSFQISGYPTVAPNELKAGALVGTYEDIQAPDGSYVLQSQNGKVGFYQVEQATATPWVRANRAYLNAPANPVKAFFFEDAVDGIRTMDNGQWTMDNAEIFNVAGQRMNKLQRGVNIVNGKKVLVK